MARRFCVVLIGFGLALATSVAWGVRAPDHLGGEVGWHAAGQTRLREYRDVQWHTPHPRTEAAWNHFLSVRGADWRAFWDRDTGVPQRIFGAGIAAPGSMASAQLAEGYARDVLREHIDLLAPGSSPDDFRVVANDRSGGMRSVGLLQHRDGMRVVGGQVSFRFKNDRLFVLASVALPDVDVAAPRTVVGARAARDVATAWIAGAFQASPAAGAVDGPMVLPLVYETGAFEYRTAIRVIVDAAAPRGRWEVYLDAETGAPIARRQTLMFATGKLQIHAPERFWQWDYLDYPAYSTTVEIAGATVETSADGTLDWSGAGDATVRLQARSPVVRVSNSGGSNIVRDVTLSDGGTYLWDESGSEFADAQLTTYIHGHRVKQWASRFSSIAWLDDQLLANVNIGNTCNAFSDGTTINFYRAGGGCGNTGRIADIVYHEFGHSFHNHALISGVGSWDGALSEGLGDFVGATITGDPAMGRGFFADESPLRHCDPDGGEQVWPDDRGEIHHTGKIYCGAMFDLRKNMIASLGETEGVAATDVLFYDSFRRADDIPSTYVELLAADDDDGNLANGTPHQCEIDEAYARHGMADPDGPVGPRVLAPRLAELAVTMPVLPFEACPAGEVTSATLDWALRDDPSQSGTVDMTLGPDGYTAEIPAPPWGSVVTWRVTANQVTGDAKSFPANPADPMYQAFYGDVDVLYCTDFESDPEADGWSHGLTSGEVTEGADDWQWGPPAGKAGDPSAAFSGERAFGNDLGVDNFNGEYQADKVNYARGPVVDVQGYDVVRLQYRRWLTVEQGEADTATIYSNDTPVWQNLADAATHHIDGEWRFHDVELTGTAAGGSVQLTFELATDTGDNYGGWTIDDVCVVAYNLPVCGNGAVEAGEECDDGNGDDTDACLSDCTVNPDGGGDGDSGGDDTGDGAGGVTSGCGCRTGGAGGSSPLWPLLLIGYALWRRRRR